MPAREAPTLRQLRLGVELRKLRERAGLTATEAGSLLGLGQSRVSNIELGRIGVSEERVRTIARVYGCVDAKLCEELAATATSRERHWWHEYRDMLPAGLLDLAEMEHHAQHMTSAQFTHVPGLLQTVDYARGILDQAIPGLTPPELEHRLSYRIKRQAVLYGDGPVGITAVVHEAALRTAFGTHGVMKAQLRHLLEVGSAQHIEVRVIPFAAGGFPGTGQTVIYAHGPIPQLDTVQLDTEHGCEFLYADAQLDRYRTFMDRVGAIALDEAQSRSHIQRLVREMQGA